MKEPHAAKHLRHRLPFLNLVNRPFRSTALILLVTLIAFVLFGGSVLAVSLQRGLESVEARFGANLIAVPLGYDTGMESILLKGEPCYFYLDKSYQEKISQVEGVEHVSAQFYLTSTSADCCDVPVQLIGFDPTTDFSIQPWIRESYGGDLASGAVLAGSDLDLNGEKSLMFFGQEYPVAAQLDKTGTGLDCAVYTDIETLYGMMRAAQDKGFQFLAGTDPNSQISSVLIKIADGYDVDTVGRNIRSSVDGLQIVKTQSMISGIAESLNTFSGILYLLVGALLLIALFMLALVFSITANERKKEFAILRILGATRKCLSSLLLAEALLVSIVGGILGVLVAALAVFPFSVAISQQLGLPYLTPQGQVLLELLAASLLITFAAGPFAAAYSAWRISRADASVTLREGD